MDECVRCHDYCLADFCNVCGGLFCPACVAAGCCGNVSMISDMVDLSLIVEIEEPGYDS
jgi:hypothetical protein